MANDRHTDRQTNGKQPYHPPRGIRFFEVDRSGTGAKKFFMQWREGGQRHSEGYTTAADRETAARALETKRAEHGSSAVLSFDPEKWRRFLEAEKLVGGVDLVDVAREWLVLRQGTDKKPGLTVEKAVERYLAIRGEEKLSKATTGHLKKHLQQRFAGTYGAQQLADVTPDMIRDWLRGGTLSRRDRVRLACGDSRYGCRRTPRLPSLRHVPIEKVQTRPTSIWLFLPRLHGAQKRTMR